jgi:hypothetical protein
MRIMIITGIGRRVVQTKIEHLCKERTLFDSLRKCSYPCLKLVDTAPRTEQTDGRMARARSTIKRALIAAPCRFRILRVCCG